MDTTANRPTQQQDAAVAGTETNLCALWAPRPRSVAETGLNRDLLQGLLARHLHESGVTDLRQLIERLRLASPVLEEILHELRALALIEVRGVIAADSNALRYALTEKGRAFALDALGKSGYVGPAPVPLDLYTRVVREQSVHRQCVTRERLHRTFERIVIHPALLDQLGAALNSGRAVFIYGPPGSGKTFTTRRLAWALGGPVLIPHAIAVGNSIVQVYDPVIHRPLPDHASAPGHLLEQGHDPRFVLCERPAVVTGGELTLDMLEIHYESETRLQSAPLQVKAANGLYVIDDLGRQRVAPVDVFNRWIVPLEEQEDHLLLANGKRFPVPFDVVLVFSTNLNPLDLADEAFLRRIGHKIAFGTLAREEYSVIWRHVCTEQGIAFDPEVLRYVLDELYAASGIPLLACHPRDLLGLALDRVRYFSETDEVDIAQIEGAWRSYFVSEESARRSGDASPATERGYSP